MSMYEAIQLKKREGHGTGAARACRREGQVPGIVYGAKKDPQAVSVDPKALIREMHKPGFFSHVFNVEIEGQKEQALIKDVQLHPVTDLPVHVDFMRVAKGTKITIRVPIHFMNEDKAPALKHGGVLNVVHHSLEVVTPVDSAPESFTVDLAAIDLSKGVHLSDLHLPAGVRPVHAERDNTIATIVMPKGEKEETAEPSE